MVTRKMRMLAASLALVLCVSLYSVPRAKAMGLEVATGSLAVATYLSATGAPLIVSPGASTGLVATGISSMASSYVGATGVASSGSAWLSSLAAGVSISPAGMIVLSAAAVVAIGALVAWYVSEQGLSDDGSSVPVYSESPESCSLISGTGEPFNYKFGKIVYTAGEPYLIYGTSESELFNLAWDGIKTTSYGSWVTVNSDSFYDYKILFYVFPASSSCYMSGFGRYDRAAATFVNQLSFIGEPNCIVRDVEQSQWVVCSGVPDSAGYNRLANKCSYSFASYPWIDEFFALSDNSLSISRTPEFTQADTELDSESQKQMVIDVGLPAGTTLDTAVTQVPELIVAGDFAPTYEITMVGTGDGTDTETNPDKETGIYIPILSDIKSALSNLGTSIVDGVMSGLKSLVVPDEAFFAEAVPALQETFQGRMGLLTFPISLLADFMGRLLDLSDQEPILRWNSVSIYGTELIAAGQYNFKDALKSAPVKQLHDIYMIMVNAILIFAFLNLCHNKYRKIMQN